MSYNEIVYINNKCPSIEMNTIHLNDIPDTNNENEEEIKTGNIIEGEESCELKKRVRFPEEGNMVSKYFEAKNYWNEQRFSSSDELITSYTKLCQFYNIKPIPILLEQIRGIDIGLCNERYDMLNLSNVKLDLKHVESMEEIFKRVQFRTLNFENTNLDDETAASLFEIIEYYESCLKLNLSHNNKISYVGFNACSKMLKKTPCLESIELKGIMFTDTTIPPFNRALRCGSNLRVLHLENSNICSKNLLILSSALKLNIHLKELHLSGNRMVPSDGIQLGSLLKVNRILEILDVRNNSLGDVGLSHICDGVCDQFQSNINKCDGDNQGQGLTCLILWSNSITYNGMSSLSDALKVSKSLQSLNLGNNQISSEGVHILRDGLLCNRTLLRLSLPCCKITCEGGVAIAEYLADTKQLMRLDIRDNDIRTAGLMAISLSMKVNKSITRLDVDPNPKKDPNVKGFVETQTESLKIIQQRVLENRRISLEIQEMEISQNLLSLSSQPQDLDSEIPDPNSTLTDPNVLLTNESFFKDPTMSSESEEVSPILISHDNMDSSSSDISDAKISMSLDLSPDADSCTVFLNFTNKVLSPTDNLLEGAIERNFGYLESSESTMEVDCDILNHDELIHNEDLESKPDNQFTLKNGPCDGKANIPESIIESTNSSCEPLSEDLKAPCDILVENALEL